MASVIVAIGPQNAFLLRQAIRREQAWLIAGIFLFGDVSMVLLGGFGIGHFLERWLWVKFLLTLLGAGYIFWFGLGVLRQILRPQDFDRRSVRHRAGSRAQGADRHLPQSACDFRYGDPGGNAGTPVSGPRQGCFHGWRHFCVGLLVPRPRLGRATFGALFIKAAGVAGHRWDNRRHHDFDGWHAGRRCLAAGANYLVVVTPAGLEPATPSLEGSCSIQLSYGVIPPKLTFADAICRGNY